MSGTAPWHRDRGLLALLAATAAMLWVAWEVKRPCLHHGWDGFQYASMCYTDMIPIYHLRGVGTGAMPYVDEMVEYPLLTGLWMFVTARIAAGPLAAILPGGRDHPDHAFFAVNAILLSVLALWVTWLLARHAPDRRRVLLWAAAPTLALSAFVTWDLIAVALAALGLWAYRQDRNLLAGIALAAGASAKVYPGLFLVMLGLELLRRERGLGPRGWRLGLGAAGTLVALHVPFLLWNPDVYLETYRFQLNRLPEWETFYSLAQTYAARHDWPWLAGLVDEGTLPWVSRTLLLVPLAAFAWAVWTRRLSGLHACMASVLVFFLANPVFNMQYVLWLLPLMVLVPMPWVAVGALWVSDTLVHRMKFDMLIHRDTPLFDAAYDRFAWWVLVRHAVFAWMLWLLWRHSRDGRTMPAARLQDDPRPPPSEQAGPPGLVVPSAADAATGHPGTAASAGPGASVPATPGRPLTPRSS